MDKTNLLILSLGASLRGCLQECQKVGILSSLKQKSIYYIYLCQNVNQPYSNGKNHIIWTLLLQVQYQTDQ